MNINNNFRFFVLKSKNAKLKYILFIIIVIIFSFSFLFSQGNNDNSNVVFNIYREPYYSLYAKGNQERIKENYSKAFTYYQHSIALNPKNPYPYFWMAYMYNQENIILPALSEVRNAIKYKNYYEYINYDTKNLNILEAYIYHNAGNIKISKEILYKKVIGVLEEDESLTQDNISRNLINKFSPNFTDININNENDRKLLPIYGDTYIILLYIKESENSLNIIEDIENNINVQMLLDANYKTDYISYLFYKNKDKSTRYDLNTLYNRKYKRYLRFEGNKTKAYYQKIINNPFIIHDFENY
ncbi:MAG: hypothetical protein ACOCUI_01020 [bacterium]